MDSQENYKWVKTKNGIGYVGIIKLKVIPVNTIEEQDIIFECEDSSNYYFQVWQPVMKQALDYALSKVKTNWRVRVLNFEGNYVYTNNAIVALTAILALWNAVGYKIDPLFIDKAGEVVVANFKSQDIPDFDLVSPSNSCCC